MNFEANFRLLLELFVDGPDGLLEIVQFHADDHKNSLHISVIRSLGLEY